MAELERAKAAAVAAEDYRRAAELKEEITALREASAAGRRVDKTV